MRNIYKTNLLKFMCCMLLIFSLLISIFPTYEVYAEGIPPWVVEQPTGHKHIYSSRLVSFQISWFKDIWDIFIYNSANTKGNFLFSEPFPFSITYTKTGEGLPLRESEWYSPFYKGNNGPFTLTPHLEQVNGGVRMIAEVKNVSSVNYDVGFLSAWTKPIGLDSFDAIKVTDSEVGLIKDTRKLYFILENGDIFEMVDKNNNPIQSIDFALVNETAKARFGYTPVTLKPGETRRFSIVMGGKGVDTISISSAYRLLGDNTNLPITLNIDAPSYFTYVLSLNNEIVLSENVGNVKSTDIILPTKNIVGDVSVTAALYDGIYFVDQNVFKSSKRDILSESISVLKSNSGSNKYILIDNKFRFFENNQDNRDLVSFIKTNSNATFIIADNVSPVIKSLLEM